ncbi:hypothetical protein DTO96_102356 [Ephemeroptericola cinctiostellae]|uniref:Lipopolysaccharide export system protein LptA n=1 Tax=Ephemeroptericola cinctiostellae TaxID=2268024 RepID=A0A345DE13_9BURK|nr:hypothetical protein [Ephemeroptericola cinctiostellae]AXF86601.1 hypothetical protein DTO96_102356 [Ephemeroptericola cinctiostellae]
MRHCVTIVALLFNALPIHPAHAQIQQSASAPPTVIANSADEAFDADFAAYMLGTSCTKFKRDDQCVIAFFDKKDQKINTHTHAVHYRVLYGKNNNLYIGQDFYASGQKQTNVYFARSETGLLNSWYNNDLMFEGNVKGYTTKGEVYFDNNYRNGVETESSHLSTPPEINATPKSNTAP